MMKYQDLSPKPNFSLIHSEIGGFWKEQNIFERSVNKPAPEVVFYDGPPFPTGKPHHGTVLVSFIKDMIARYWTMRGYSVPRVWGWDCHGLPIENQAETLMGITDKNEIENEPETTSSEAITADGILSDFESTDINGNVVDDEECSYIQLRSVNGYLYMQRI